MTNLQLTWELEANLGFKMFSPIAEGNFFSCQYCASHESTPASASKRVASDNRQQSVVAVSFHLYICTITHTRWGGFRFCRQDGLGWAFFWGSFGAREMLEGATLASTSHLFLRLLLWKVWQGAKYAKCAQLGKTVWAFKLLLGMGSRCFKP